MENVKAIKLILKEVSRIQQTADYLRNSPDKLEWQCNIPLPTGGMVLCGRLGVKKIREVAKRAYFDSWEISSTCDLDSFVEEIRKEIGSKFIRRKREVSEETVGEMIMDAYRNLRAKFQKWTHYVPCWLFAHEEPNEFTIGPVTFTHISLFKERHQKQVEEYLLSEKPFSEDDWQKIEIFFFNSERAKKARREVKERCFRMRARKGKQQTLERFRKSYLNYNWIASVTIAPCEKKLSDKQTDFLVEHTLNIMRLVLGEAHSGKLGRSIVSNAPTEIFRLHRDEKQEFHYSSQSVSPEHLYKNWYEGLSEAQNELKILGDVLSKFAQLLPLSHLEERLIDALTWYGEAVTEPLPALKVVKFINAIERLTVTEQTTRLTKLIVRRSAGLVKSTCNENCLEDISSFYNLRSDLVHGRKSPWDKRLPSEMLGLSGLCRKIILSAIQLFSVLGINDNSRDSVELSKVYDRLYPPPKKEADKKQA